MSPTRREVLASLSGGIALAAVSPAPHGAEAPSSPGLRPRIRAITIGTTLAGPDDSKAFEAVLAPLARARAHFERAGYEVQTIRIAMQAALVADDVASRTQALAHLETLDRLAAERGVTVSIGPLSPADGDDGALAEWCAELVQRTRTISFSLSVASAGQSVRHAACLTAARIMRALASATPGGIANFRFAAAANILPGTPFFPVGFHEGRTALSIGLESAGLVERVFAGALNKEDGEKRLREAFNEALTPVAKLATEFAGDAGLAYRGIDPSPAPGLDRSIGAAIESATNRPFGSAGTLGACAAVTAALQNLAVRTCGYAGLMLPVLEDAVLAARAKEGRYDINDLLLYSSVCGTGLDVVPIAGATPVEAIARVIGDMAALSVKWQKPLSARLFPVPGAKAGDSVRIDDPHLTESAVFAVA